MTTAAAARPGDAGAYALITIPLVNGALALLAPQSAGILIAATVLASAFVVEADARSIGYGSAKTTSPIVWALGALLLWPVATLVYLGSRSYLGARNFAVLGIVAVGLGAMLPLAGVVVRNVAPASAEADRVEQQNNEAIRRARRALGQTTR